MIEKYIGTPKIVVPEKHRNIDSGLFKLVEARDRKTTAELQKIVDKTKEIANRHTKQNEENLAWMEKTVENFTEVLAERWHYEQTL
jgi:hypothetical protein